MALIAMCAYSTEENRKADMFAKTIVGVLLSMNETDRLFIIDNASTDERHIERLNSMENTARSVIPNFSQNVTIIKNKENVGTAKGINMAWKHRAEGECLVKMDDDVIIHDRQWIRKMEDAISRDSKLGILGLKRNDLLETPHSDSPFFRSELYMLPQEKGQRWIAVERAKHVMGTCQMYNPLLIDKIGGLYQMDGVYGFDDSLAAIRCELAGFYSAFYCGIDIDHIDDGATDYQRWKEKYAGEMMEKYNIARNEYYAGVKDIYQPL